MSNKSKDYEISTSDLLISILKNNEKVKKTFNTSGVTFSELSDNKEKQKELCTKKKENKKTEIKEINKKEITKTRSIKSFSNVINNEVEKQLINLNVKSIEGKIDKIIGHENTYKIIFNTLLKKSKNNVILVGDSGIGKTSIVKNIANLLNSNEVPRQFLGKQLMEMDFTNLISNTSFKGMFESKLKLIIEDASKNGNYIFFIDDIESILSENSRLGEINTDKLLINILSNNKIQCICTTSHKGYNNYISKNKSLKREFQKITINEPDEKLMKSIIDYHSGILEEYHNVSFSDECIKDCILLSKKYINDICMPDSAIDLLDQTASSIVMSKKVNDKIIEYENDLNEVLKKKDEILHSNKYNADEYDNLTKIELSIKSNISSIEKEEILNNKPLDITSDNLKNTLSEKLNIPLSDLNTEEKKTLMGMNDRIKDIVIGQDNAVDSVCQAVKRKRIGISSIGKPVVLFFAGSTGTGKTYLAKTLAKEVFGSEDKLVRLDMSEYMDKISANKLYGTSAGYVGYDNGGILTNAIKKNKYCVLLLDEIEKAHETIHNAFLQLFDEGRMTDNTGEVVDFKNVIIIMTSNIGVKESMERGMQIGFNKSSNFTNEIIYKELNKKFKPEFINRIDKIVLFNKLNEENIKKIIKLELIKLKKRVETIGYSFNENMLDDSIINFLYSKIDNSDFGARPILRIIENELENKITDFIIENDIEKGFEFNSKLFLE